MMSKTLFFFQQTSLLLDTSYVQTPYKCKAKMEGRAWQILKEEKVKRHVVETKWEQESKKQWEKGSVLSRSTCWLPPQIFEEQNFMSALVSPSSCPKIGRLWASFARNLSRSFCLQHYPVACSLVIFLAAGILCSWHHLELSPQQFRIIVVWH